MASPQFIELLEQLHETGQQKLLRWEPVRRSRYGSRCNFCLALGGGVVHLTSNDDDEQVWRATYRAFLMTRDGLLVDEIEGNQQEGGHYELVRDLFRQARVAAFNLPRLVEDMQADLAAGRTRELPKELVKPDTPDDMPF